MVVDDKSAFVKSLNWTTKNLTETRDYAVVTERKRDVPRSSTADSDWHRETFSPQRIVTDLVSRRRSRPDL